MKMYFSENKNVGKICAAVIIAMLCVAFTACGGDDNENISDGSAVTTVGVAETSQPDSISGDDIPADGSGSAAVSHDEKDTEEVVVTGDTVPGGEDVKNTESTKNTGSSGSASGTDKGGSTTSGTTSGATSGTSASTSASTSAGTSGETTTTIKVTTPSDMPEPPSIFETLPNGGIELPDDVWEY